MNASQPTFQRARLAEQLRLSKHPTKNEVVANGETSQTESSEVSPASEEVCSEGDEARVSPSSDASVDAEEERDAFEMERADSDGMPFAPMLTYQKYLTMQEKRVHVNIRYSAEAGLRPLYLTVADQIKSAHPDVLLERRILPPVSSIGSDAAIFEIIVDGKTVIGKKKTKMLKVTSRVSRKSGDDHNNKGDDVKRKGKKNSAKKSSDGDSITPDIAGGRSVFVSMEKLGQELSKARKRRRPNTMYKSKEIASGSVSGDAVATNESIEGGSNAAVQSSGMAEAVIRLERLKAMSRTLQ